MKILAGTLNALVFFILPWIILIAIANNAYKDVEMPSYDKVRYDDEP